MTSRAPTPVTAAAPETARADAAVARLYHEHQPFVWRNARRLGCADEWVDDAVQEVFLVAARRLHELTAESDTRGWLFAIVFRVMQRMQRDRARYRARIHRYSETRSDARAASPEDTSQAARQLRELLAMLNEEQRVVVILIELEGMTSAEVARVLRVPPGTVDSRLRAARKQLQQFLERQRASDERQSP